MRQSRKHLAKTSLFGCTKVICYLHNSHLYTTGGWYEFNNFVLQWNRLNAQRSKLTCFSNLHRSEVSCPGQNCEELWQAGVSQVKLVVKNPPANAGDVRDVGSIPDGDPLVEGMAAHSSILAWRTPWTVEPGGLQSTGSQRVRHDCCNWAHTHTNSHEVSFWGDWNVLELDIVMFTQYCEYAKNH